MSKSRKPPTRGPQRRENRPGQRPPRVPPEDPKAQPSPSTARSGLRLRIFLSAGIGSLVGLAAVVLIIALFGKTPSPHAEQTMAMRADRLKTDAGSSTEVRESGASSVASHGMSGQLKPADDLSDGTSLEASSSDLVARPPSQSSLPPARSITQEQPKDPLNSRAKDEAPQRPIAKTPADHTMDDGDPNGNLDPVHELSDSTSAPAASSAIAPHEGVRPESEAAGRSPNDLQEPTDSATPSAEAAGPRYVVLPERTAEGVQQVTQLDGTFSPNAVLKLATATVDQRGQRRFQLKPSVSDDGTRRIWTVESSSGGMTFPIGTFQVDRQLLNFAWAPNAPMWAKPELLAISVLEVREGEETNAFVFTEPKTTPDVKLLLDKPCDIPINCSDIAANDLKVSLSFDPAPTGLTITPATIVDLKPGAPQRIRVDPQINSTFARTDFEIETKCRYVDSNHTISLDFDAYMYTRTRIRGSTFGKEKLSLKSCTLASLAKMKKEAAELSKKFPTSAAYGSRTFSGTSSMNRRGTDLPTSSRLRGRPGRSGSVSRSSTAPSSTPAYPSLGDTKGYGDLEEYGQTSKVPSNTWSELIRRLDAMDTVLRSKLPQVKVTYLIYVEAEGHRLHLVRSESASMPP